VPRRNIPKTALEFASPADYSFSMRRWLICLLLAGLCAAPLSGWAASGRVIKVLPFFVDREGRHTLTPDLFERDGYQDYLRLHPGQISNMLFVVHWKIKGEPVAPVKLRIELRGVPRAGASTQTVLEQSVQARGRFSHWSDLVLSASQFKELNEVTAWRATLWEGGVMLNEQDSFLW
jgi:hypothetical protein